MPCKVVLLLGCVALSGCALGSPFERLTKTTQDTEQAQGEVAYETLNINVDPKFASRK